jgi:hypothetical protein
MHFIEKNYGFILGAFEASLGSLLHAFHVPLSGHFLSLNQIFVLSLASKDLKKSAALFRVSLYAGFIKLSFGHNMKLMPMLAICAQGCLFSLGSIFHLYLGAALASLWSFFQSLFFPFFILQIMTIGDLIGFLHFYMPMVSVFKNQIYILFIFLIIFKISLSILVCYLGQKKSHLFLNSYLNFVMTKKNIDKKKIFSPIAFLYLISVSVFYFYTKKDVWISLTLRAIGFYVIATLLGQTLLLWLKKYEPKT